MNSTPLPPPAGAMLGKVTAFVTRESAAGRDLLVFQHPTAGIQLPAGTMEAGETPEAAVLRETREEAALSAVRVAALLATIQQPLLADEWLLLAPITLAAPSGPVTLTRGHPVHLIERRGADCRVSYRWQLTASGFQPDSDCVGWLPGALLTTNVRRHLFHLTLTAPTPERWSVAADGHTFALYWTPLARRVGLIALQAVWLDAVYPQLAPGS